MELSYITGDYWSLGPGGPLFAYLPSLLLLKERSQRSQQWPLFTASLQLSYSFILIMQNLSGSVRYDINILFHVLHPCQVDLLILVPFVLFS